MLHKVYQFSNIFTNDVVMNMYLKVVIATKRSTLDVCECPEEAFKSDLLIFWCRFWKGEEEWVSIFELFSRPSKIVRKFVAKRFYV